MSLRPISKHRERPCSPQNNKTLHSGGRDRTTINLRLHKRQRLNQEPVAKKVWVWWWWWWWGGVFTLTLEAELQPKPGLLALSKSVILLDPNGTSCQTPITCTTPITLPKTLFAGCIIPQFHRLGNRGLGWLSELWRPWCSLHPRPQEVKGRSGVNRSAGGQQTQREFA